MTIKEELPKELLARIYKKMKLFRIRDIKHFTCYDCLDRLACEYAFDPYNLSGDCLVEK